MRIAHVLTLAAAAAVSFSASAAPDVSTASSAFSSTVPVTARALYKLNRHDYQKVQGAYELEDGRLLRVSTSHGKLYAELDGKLNEIVPTGPNQFASHDDALRVRFDQMSAVNEVEVSVPRG